MASDGLNPLPSEGRLPSRYKSVRRTVSSESQSAASTPPSVPTIPQAIPENGQSNGLQRSRSRYHRAASVAQSAQPSPPNRTRAERPRREPVPDLPSQAIPQVPTTERTRPTTANAQRVQTSFSKGEGSGNSSSRTPKRATTSSRNQEHGRKRDEMAGLTEGESILAKEQARYDKIKAQQRADRDAKHKAAEMERMRLQRDQDERDRMAREAEEEEQRRRDDIANEQRRVREEAEAKRREDREDSERRKKLRRLKKEDISRPRPVDTRKPTRQEYDASPPLETPHTISSPTSSSHAVPKLGGLFKRRHHDSPSPPKSSENIRPKTSHASPPKFSGLLNSAKKSTTAEMPMIKPGGKGIVPLTDAPISASNHGERRVKIQCGKKFIDLPFTSTTSALQLIRSTATVMSECPDPRTSVMYESFTKCGVQRPLRMYEPVRNVINSWDSDAQHSLMIVPSDAGLNNELYKDFAPKERPETQSWWLYYSPKANKWDKRLVTLREDGQIIMAKNEAGKDANNICHLTDFETYTPTQDWKKRVVRPPKKYCYCVKSQQKSSMFEELTNFIHYFCSNDKQVADSFFSTIQSWRSWYIYNVMGEGQVSKGEQKEVKTGTLKDKSDEPQVARTGNRDSYYALGTFNTLGLDFQGFAKETPGERPNPKRRSHSFSGDYDRPLATLGMLPGMPSAQEHSRSQNTRQPSVSQKGRNHPPVAYKGAHDGSQSNHRTKPSWNSQQSGEAAFNPHGLLGQTYEERQQALQASDNANTSGLNRSASQRSNRTMHRRNSIDGGSIRHGPKPKPLIDLTPQYREPPQHFRKGKGFKPEHVPDGGLVDAIPDNIETPIQLPGANEWKARPTTSSGIQRNATVSGGHHRSRSVKGRRDDTTERDVAFTGLIAKSGPGKSQYPKKRRGWLRKALHLLRGGKKHDSDIHVDHTVTLDGSTDQNLPHATSQSDWNPPDGWIPSPLPPIKASIHPQRALEAINRRHLAMNRTYSEEMVYMNQYRHDNMPVTPGNANAYVGDGSLASGAFMGPVHPGRSFVPVEPFKRPMSWGKDTEESRGSIDGRK
ncbi:hypothetical protein BLS_004346 [Venturia inaequalis]|uniref:Uncharacterized protein n=1 Tax=Venturia inaequalis TaxID=5025 RepID=A0A8H3YSE9_VENIN|nr:hypothetical protein BLS_004346 [Venturia inaequalis]